MLFSGGLWAGVAERTTYLRGLMAETSWFCCDSRPTLSPQNDPRTYFDSHPRITRIPPTIPTQRSELLDHLTLGAITARATASILLEAGTHVSFDSILLCLAILQKCQTYWTGEFHTKPDRQVSDET